MKTSKIKAAFLWIMLASLCAVSAQAADLTVRQAWSRATPKSAQVAGGYLTIDNLGKTPDKLLSASSEVARKVEIHEMAVQDGIMMMRAVEDGLRVAPGEILTLEPGGTHIMFIGLTAPLSEGQQLPVSLFFEHAGRIDATFDVGSVGAKGPRLLLASTRPAANPVIAQERASESFFTHICGTELMANVTVSPGKPGPVEVTVQLEDADEKPLVAQALTVTLSNPDKGVAPATASADRVSPDTWKVRMSDERTLDVRQIEPRFRHAIIIKLFEALIPGKSLQLTADHRPRPLQHQMELRYGARCGWSYLEEGPDVWRVRLHRIALDEASVCEPDASSG